MIHLSNETQKQVYTFGCNDEYALGRDNDDEIDKVDLPERCIEITAGDSHTAALSESGVVYAWGTFGVSTSSCLSSINPQMNMFFKCFCWPFC